MTQNPIECLKPNSAAPVRKRYRLLPALLALALGAAATRGAQTSNNDAPIQDAFNQLAQAQTEAQQSTALQVFAQFDAAEVVRGAVRYAAKAESARKAAVPGAVLNHLELTHSQIVSAAIPLLEDPDANVVHQTENVLAGYEHRSAERRPDFSIYRPILARAARENESPDALVAYLYRADAGQALLTMMRARQVRDPDRLKQLRWAEHRVADVLWQHRFGFLPPDRSDARADAELRTLATDNVWWVRLFVAETMRTHEAFRNAAVVEALAVDEHPLVRKAAQAATAP